jgi:hypothetical protein
MILNNKNITKSNVIISQHLKQQPRLKIANK